MNIMNCNKAIKTIEESLKDVAKSASSPLRDTYKYMKGPEVYEQDLFKSAEENKQASSGLGFVDALKKGHQTDGAYDGVKIAKTAGIGYAGIKTAGALFGGSHSNDDQMLN